MPNEARAWEGLPPVDGGDQLYMQGATVPIDELGVVQAPAPEPVKSAPRTFSIKRDPEGNAIITATE